MNRKSHPPDRRLAAFPAAVLLTLAAASSAEETREVFVVNLPEVQQVEGTISLAGPSPHTTLALLEEAVVSPVKPEETTALVSGGTLVSEGFVSVVLSLAGQIRADLFQSGQVGALLIPDEEPIVTAFEEEGQILFPLKVEADAGAAVGTYFSSQQTSLQLGFPRYRVYFYNTTDRPASVTLFAYLAN